MPTKTAPAFSSFGFKSGLIATLDRQFPSYLSGWNNGHLNVNDADATHFIYAHEGDVFFSFEGRDYRLFTHQFACLPGAFQLRGATSRGVVISRERFNGFFQIGGPIERCGRLKYIDGCTDSLLVPPVRCGDPCLNLLYFPPGIDQTAHTHPSDRIGLILSGRGRCHYWPKEDDLQETRVDLTAGMIFCIHTEGKHKFSTPYGEEMRVLAYHPDSDFGPTDESHPMINRTIVDGVPASQIEEIRTR